MGTNKFSFCSHFISSGPQRWTPLRTKDFGISSHTNIFISLKTVLLSSNGVVLSSYICYLKWLHGPVVAFHIIESGTSGCETAVFSTHKHNTLNSPSHYKPGSTTEFTVEKKLSSTGPTFFINSFKLKFLIKKNE